LCLNCINIYASIPITMEFEFDPEKSRNNREKHGIDFNQAQALWNDSGLITLLSRYSEEPRYLAIGRVEGLHWTAVFTERSDRVRLISVRRSRQNERNLYEQNQPT